MKKLSLILFAFMILGAGGMFSAAQAGIFVSKGKSSNSSGGGGGIYVKPERSGSKKSEGSSTIYNKTDGEGPRFTPRRMQNNNPGTVVNPREATRNENVRAAQKMSEKTNRRVQREMEKARIARDQRIAEREKAWAEKQKQDPAHQAALERMRKASAYERQQQQSGQSTNTGTGAAPATPATQRVYRGNDTSSGTNASGGRVFNAR